MKTSTIVGTLREVTLGATLTPQGSGDLENLATSLELWGLQEAGLMDLLEIIQSGLELKLAKDIDEDIHRQYQDLRKKAVGIMEERRELVRKLEERKALEAATKESGNG